MASSSDPVRHHLVSKGYQKNFADETQKLSVVDARRGTLIERLRPTKRNWVEDHWNSFPDDDGGQNAHLEKEFARIEATVMRSIREVKVGGVSPRQRAAIVNLFAIHLVRSRAFVDFRESIYDVAVPESVDRLVDDPDIVAAFGDHLGRPADPGELRRFVEERAVGRLRSKAALLETVGEQHNKMAEKLDGFHIQVVEIAEGLPGFVLGDVPVIHADLHSGRFGFRDRLAIGDATLVGAALTRTSAAFFTVRPQRNETLTSKSKVREVNALFVRAAVSEVASHPDDALELSRLCRNPPQLKRP